MIGDNRDDIEQMEYIKKWLQMQEERKEKRKNKREVLKIYFVTGMRYFKTGFRCLFLGLKACFKSVNKF